MSSQWIQWIKQIKAISQTGKAYTDGKYDLQRYHQLDQIAHEMLSLVAEAPIGKIDNFYLPDKGYATPKTDLRAGIIQDGKILLVKERSDGKWALPGGWADVGETPKQGIEREVSEESGYQVKAEKLIAVIDRGVHPYTLNTPYHIYKLFFSCSVLGGDKQANLEISDIDFFDPNSLPELSLSRTIKNDIELFFQHHHKPDLPTYFD